MNNILSENPLLLLFIVASLGYLFGSIKIKGSSLGVAAILFTGLAFGALSPDLQVPDIIFQLGLALFIYSLGLSSGPAFFKSYQQNGLRDILFALSMLVFSGLIACGIFYLCGFSAATITGIYSGSTTNTAALAGVLDYISNTYPSKEAAILTQEAVVGYSLSYPMGILGTLLSIILLEKILKINYQKEMQELKHQYPVDQDLTSTTIEITNKDILGVSLRELFRRYDWNVIFGRVVKNGKFSLSNYDTSFKIGDFAMIVGSKEDIASVIEILGQKSNSPLSFDRHNFDSRRIFVSNPMVVGRSLAELNLSEKYNAVITRIRRGDVDMLAHGETVLELGDRIRFIAERKYLKQLSAFFGDSYQDSSKVNLFSFGLGIGLGLLLGMIEFSFGENLTFKLGYAGGPLIVGLILGSLRRTGAIVWTLPYGANITLQQIGLIFLLSTIGLRSGSAFISSLSLEGLYIFAMSAVISIATAAVIILIGYKYLKIPFSLLSGMVSTQPAILDVAMDRSKSIIPTFGFTMMMPLAMISKIVIAQLLFLLLM